MVAVWVKDHDGNLVLKPKVCPTDTAKALLATKEAFELLPHVNLLVRAPISGGLRRRSASSLERLSRLSGWSADNGRESAGGNVRRSCCRRVEGIFSEFDFQTPGDHSRAIAAILTPAMKMGGFIRGLIPIDIAEANESQSGKNYRQKNRRRNLSRAHLPRHP